MSQIQHQMCGCSTSRRTASTISAACAPSGLAIVGSVYFADGFARRDGEQAVVAGVCGAEGATVKWALRRVRQADRPADSPLQA